MESGGREAIISPDQAASEGLAKQRNRIGIFGCCKDGNKNDDYDNNNGINSDKLLRNRDRTETILDNNLRLGQPLRSFSCPMTSISNELHPRCSRRSRTFQLVKYSATYINFRYSKSPIYLH